MLKNGEKIRSACTLAQCFVLSNRYNTSVQTHEEENLKMERSQIICWDV